jgi:hypothetical protein
MKLMRISPFTGKTNTLDLPIGEHDFRMALAKWQDGAMIQDAFPMLNAGEREFVKTGITPEEWADTFGEDN